MGSLSPGHSGLGSALLAESPPSLVPHGCSPGAPGTHCHAAVCLPLGVRALGRSHGEEATQGPGH